MWGLTAQCLQVRPTASIHLCPTVPLAVIRTDTQLPPCHPHYKCISCYLPIWWLPHKLNRSPNNNSTSDSSLSRCYLLQRQPPSHTKYISDSGSISWYTAQFIWLAIFLVYTLTPCRCNMPHRISYLKGETRKETRKRSDKGKNQSRRLKTRHGS